MSQFIKLGSGRAMLASDVGIEMLAIYLTKMGSVPLVRCTSSEDVAVVVDFHWFTDCLATWRRSFTWTRHDFNLTSDHRWRKRCSSDHRRFSLKETRYSSAPSITTVWSNYQTSYNDFFEVCITETVTLAPNGRFDQFNSIINLSTRSCDQSFFVLIGQNRLQLMSVMTIHKYVNVQASVVGPQ